jgi:hypothetical protein
MDDKPNINPNATIQLDRPSLLDTVLLDDDADAELLPPSTHPPPLPPSEIAKVSASPAPIAASVAPPAAKGKPWLVPVVLVIGVAIAIGAGIKVGGLLHAARTANDPKNTSAVATPAAPAAAPQASASEAPVITVPVIEMNDPH